MKKVFIDCGVREGDAIAAFLGNKNAGSGKYSKYLKGRVDSDDFQLIGFESPDNKYLQGTVNRFKDYNFSLIEKLAWIFDGVIDFDSDGESLDCRIFQISRTENRNPWRHPNPNAIIKTIECIDLARFLNDNYSTSDYVILKLDIEGAEYDILQRLIETNAILIIKELYVEYHWWGNTRLRPYIESFIYNNPTIYYRNDWP